jgi:hypothetical protein
MRTRILAAGAFLVIGAALAGPFVRGAAAQESVEAYDTRAR